MDKRIFSGALPADVEQIINTLMEQGYEAYAVGGCIRDTLLDREPGDWDITTSASPAAVKDIFKRTVDTGLQHGTVTVLIGKNGYEVTTYRIDGSYQDGRHPDSVEFTTSLEEDLKRRDFTINAMAYNHVNGLVDIFGGIDDLKKGLIRCVGDAEARFTEDALRILRAVRFSAQLGFAIGDETEAAIRRLAGSLDKISKERIHTELNKLLVSGHPEYFEILYQTGITAVIMPEFDQMMRMPQNNGSHCFNVGCHTLAALRETPADRVLRWSALLHDVGKIHTHCINDQGEDYFPDHAKKSAEMAETIMRGLKMDNQTIDRVVKLIRFHSYQFRMDKVCVRKLLWQVGEDLFPDLLKLMYADTMAKSEKIKALRLGQLEQIGAMYREIIADQDCISLKMLAVGGNDLIAAGISPGREIGIKLEELLLAVLENPQLNTKSELLKLL